MGTFSTDLWANLTSFATPKSFAKALAIRRYQGIIEDFRKTSLNMRV
jgi:hypothetical protein